MTRRIHAADLFAGAGGTSTGLLQAADELGLGVELLAINHWDTAVESHAQNHPDARHLCASLDQLDPSKVIPRRKLDLLLASPECTHHSHARGGKPMDDQSRASAWHVLHWAERLRVENILVENVREFADWGPLDSKGKRPLKSRKGETFRAWVRALESLGYRVEWRILNCADHGDATTRKRLFVSATRRHGKGSLWPTSSHGQPDLFAGDVTPWRPAREVIDWTLEGESIFARKRPLAENTMRRIAEGLRRFSGSEPFLLSQQSGGAPRGGQRLRRLQLGRASRGGCAPRLRDRQPGVPRGAGGVDAPAAEVGAGARGSLPGRRVREGRRVKAASHHQVLSRGGYVSPAAAVIPGATTSAPIAARRSVRPPCSRAGRFMRIRRRAAWQRQELISAVPPRAWELMPPRCPQRDAGGSIRPCSGRRSCGEGRRRCPRGGSVAPLGCRCSVASPRGLANTSRRSKRCLTSTSRLCPRCPSKATTAMPSRCSTRISTA